MVLICQDTIKGEKYYENFYNTLKWSFIIPLLFFTLHYFLLYILNSKRWLTINVANVNKLNTLKKICDDIKCSINEVIFFGDGENDLILIENAGIGIAMGNAIDIVKERATYVTLSNDNDGIAEYLENNLE